MMQEPIQEQEPVQYADGADLLQSEPEECWDEIDEIREEQRLIRLAMYANPWEV